MYLCRRIPNNLHSYSLFTVRRVGVTLHPLSVTSFQSIVYGKEEKEYVYIREICETLPQLGDCGLYPHWCHVGSMNSSCDGMEWHLISVAIFPKPHNSILVIKEETPIQRYSNKNMPLYYSWKHSNPLKTGTSLKTVTV